MIFRIKMSIKKWFLKVIFNLTYFHFHITVHIKIYRHVFFSLQNKTHQKLTWWAQPSSDATDWPSWELWEEAKFNGVMFGRTIAWVWRIIGGTTWGLEVLSVLFFLGPSFLPFLDSVGRITLCCILTWVLNVYNQKERHISLEIFVLKLELYIYFLT